MVEVFGAEALKTHNLMIIKSNAHQDNKAREGRPKEKMDAIEGTDRHINKVCEENSPTMGGLTVSQTFN